ncbi:PaaI family thioesterase [Paenibacillus puerhi]|uniref:PaaI family thioesterase n=1 Tax=Paenibacillus puerhi TaxID=2692622 RepID=UPI0013587B08|nr:PaaI family thioesterase [Paenibacillus puerhi]
MENEVPVSLAGMEQSAVGTFWTHIGAELRTLSAERVEVALEVQPHHLNTLGILHGGVSATLLDSAMGLVAMAARPQDTVVTTNLHLHYVAPVEQGALKVTAEIVHSSRKLITAQGHVYDDKGALCTFGTGTFRVLEHKPARETGAGAGASAGASAENDD